MRSAFIRPACRTIVRARGPWAKTWWSVVRGPVVACPRATRADALCLAEEDSTGLFHGGQGAFLCHGIPASARSKGRWIDHMEKRHSLRLTVGERFECLYPPLRAF